MSQDSKVITINEIRDVYEKHCEKEKIKFSEKDFAEFLKFLELDFYDWTRENLRQYLLNNEFVKLK